MTVSVRYSQVVCLLIIVIGGIFWNASNELVYPAYVFPRIVLSLIFASAAVALIVDSTRARDPLPFFTSALLFAIVIAGTVVAYIVVIQYLGYYLTTAAYLFLTYLMVNRKKEGISLTLRFLAVAAVASIGVVAAIYVVFTVLLKINVPMLLPNGPF
jgi:hypothetical protein